MTTATGSICEALETYGATIGRDEIDDRPLPEPEAIETAIACVFEPIAGLFDDSPLVQDLDAMLWGFVNAYHAQVNRLNRALDDNERTQARVREQHDGSEINDTALREAIDQGRALIDRQNAFLTMFDAAAREFEAATGSTWQPRHGSRPRTQHLTAAMVDSRDFTRARRQTWTENNLPKGPYVIVSGGDFKDVDVVWQRLDRIKARHPEMTLLHGGAPGVDTIAAKWADNRRVTQVRFGLDRQLGNRAGFVRNEKMLDAVPIGVITFPGNGVTKALKRKAEQLGVPVWDYEASQATCGRTSNEPAPDDARDAIKRLGVGLVARHFGIKEKTVNAWLRKGIPTYRVDAVLALKS